MHYYERNIGDYYRKAGRLNILQHGVYNLLIDACYDRECFPESIEEAIDWVWAETDDELNAVEFVLKKFFKFEDGFYVQNHIKEDLDNYKAFLEKQTENGKKGGRPPKQKKSDNLANNGNELGNSSLNNETQNNPTETQNNPNKPKESLNHRTTKPINQEPIISSSGSSVREEKIEQSDFKPQKNVIAGYATYHTDDPTPYSLIEAEQADPNLVENFIEQAKASYPMHKLTAENYNELFQKLRQWSLEKRVGQTRQKWMNSWLTIVKNNAHTFAESPEKPSHFKNSRQAEKPKHRYGTGVVKQSEQQDQMRDVVGVTHE